MIYNIYPDNRMDIIDLIIYISAILVVVVLVLALYYLMNPKEAPKAEVEGAANYTPVLINSGINLYYIPNFLTSSECDHIVNITQNEFTRSGVVINGKNGYANGRTSHTHYLARDQDEVVVSILQRVALVVNMPQECIEALQVVKYESGEEFREHHDWFRKDYMDRINGNQRKYTFFVYLNDVEDGGYTRFPKLNVSFKPKKGAALFWQNCTSHEMCFDDSLHQGEPPKRAVKYGLNIWVNFDPIKY
jgi:hypothetical protein